MNEIVKLYKDHPVRIIEKDGEPWFVAKDVGDAIKLRNPRSSIAILDKDERRVHEVATNGGMQNMTIVNENGLYSMVMRSRKKEARDFKRWVTCEVMPSIRKKGNYLSTDIYNKQISAFISTIEKEVTRRVEVECQAKILARQVEKLSEISLPKRQFGETSEVTGLPKDIVVGSYVKSSRHPHKPQHLKYVQLLMPLYTTHEMLGKLIESNTKIMEIANA